MACITIRNIDDGLKHRVLSRAAQHGRAMEEEARRILHQAIGKSAGHANLGKAIHLWSATLGGVDLDLPWREPMPEPRRFD